ncbi:MAG: hypothetical protein NUV98_02265 [Candidatus Roizmanbacteria bacterium]|nr:hypothetical protein [Candidatus Roizmanbacteria bacterium]
MYHKLFLSLLLSVTFFLQTISVPLAVTPPEFPSCLNPEGAIKSSYSSGTHGVVGSNQTYTGSDTVYTLSDNRLSQCFCSENGDGIQTNWWKISSLTEGEVQILKNQEWFFVPNGALWGLEDTSYMAKNSTYSCKSTDGSVGGTSDSNSSEGSVLEGSTQNVLGLASTGNIRMILTFFSLGLTLLLVGLSIKKSTS